MRGKAAIFPLLAGTAAFVRGLSSNLQTRSSKADLGTFENPSPRARPRFRYWIPDASVNLTTVAQDVADAGRVEAGGVELLGYYNYGLQVGWTGTDWTEYGWGTPAWSKLSPSMSRSLCERLFSQFHQKLFKIRLFKRRKTTISSLISLWDLMRVLVYPRSMTRTDFNGISCRSTLPFQSVATSTIRYQAGALGHLSRRLLVSSSR